MSSIPEPLCELLCSWQLNRVAGKRRQGMYGGAATRSDPATLLHKAQVCWSTGTVKKNIQCHVLWQIFYDGIHLVVKLIYPLQLVNHSGCHKCDNKFVKRKLWIHFRCSYAHFRRQNEDTQIGIKLRYGVLPKGKKELFLSIRPPTDWAYIQR